MSVSSCYYGVIPITGTGTLMTGRRGAQKSHDDDDGDCDDDLDIDQPM